MDKKRSLVFNKATIQKLKTNYSPIEEITILNNSSANPSNTFNTFWKGVERESHKATIKSIEILEDTEGMGFNEDNAERSTEINNNPIF